MLRDVTLSVRPGERVAIGSPPGAGKSTLVDALASLHPLAAGQLRYDGHDVRYLSLEHRRSLVAFVRGTELASDTIESNLRYARPDAEVRDLVRPFGIRKAAGQWAEFRWRPCFPHSSAGAVRSSSSALLPLP